jgi:hypothetical protein
MKFDAKKSARGLAHSKAQSAEVGVEWREASWSAAALCRFE